MSLLMLSTNLGWAFLITWLPTFLKEQQKAGDVAVGRMVTIVLGCGMLGQLAGGFFSDWCARRFGLHHRAEVVAISAAGLAGGAAYLGCLGSSTVWGVVAFCCLVSFCNDTGNPANWAFLQDVGGARVTAAASRLVQRMWGNFGAGLVSILVPRAARDRRDRGGRPAPCLPRLRRGPFPRRPDRSGPERGKAARRGRRLRTVPGIFPRASRASA